MRARVLCYVLSGSILLFSCNKGSDPQPPNNNNHSLSPFTVSVSNRQAVTAQLTWTAAINNNNSDPVFYRVMLGSNIVANNLSVTNYTLTSLVAPNTYSGKVMAYTNSGDTASATFSIGTYTVTSNYSYVNGYYKVFETTTGGGYTYNHVFTGRVNLLNDSTIAFTQSSRIPFTWWTADFTTKIYPSLGDSLIGQGITPKGRILSQTLIRMSYLFGASLVYDVKQYWQKLANPSDSTLYAYVYPNFAGMIKTIAGKSTGADGNAGDGGPAIAAELNVPVDVAADNTGNIYVTHGFSNYSIRKINTSGIITRYAGNNTSGFSGDGGPAVNAQLNFPLGLTADNAGNVFISDAGNRVIRKVNSSGIISTFAGTPGSFGYSGDGGQATAATMGSPNGLAVDATGNLYFADAAKHVVRKISTTGIITTVAGNGTAGYSGDNGAATAAKLNGPTDVSFDAAGNMYIADKDNNVVRKVTTAGIITTYAGTGIAGNSGNGGMATAATLNKPYSVTFDNSGNMYISDQQNDRIRKVTAAGVISLYAGGGTNQWGAGPDFYAGDHGAATSAMFFSPYGILTTSTGLLIVDANRIRKVLF